MTAAAGPSHQPIRVLHLTAVEASNYYLNNLVDFTDRSIIEFSAVTSCAPCPFVAEFDRRGLNAHALDCRSPARLPAALVGLIRIVRAESIDVLHGHLFWPSFVSVLLGRALGRAVIVTRHHSDAVHKIPGLVRRAAYQQLGCWTNRLADHIIAPAAFVREVLIEQESVPLEKISLIPYGQRPERFVLRQEDIGQIRSSFGPSPLHLVCVSRLHPEKGHSFLLEALSALVRSGIDATLHLVGQGPGHSTLARTAGHLGISDRVRFLGWRDDALEIMAAADVVVHPSLHEALPSSVIEAVMLEKPVVASDVSGVRDILGDSAYGAVVPPADIKALFQALVHTIRDLPHARQRAAAGRQAVLESMGAARVAKAYEACYRAVLSRRRAGDCR